MPGLGAEEGLVLHADVVGALDDDVAGDRRVAVADHEVAHDVAVGVDGRRLDGGLGVDERAVTS